MPDKHILIFMKFSFILVILNIFPIFVFAQMEGSIQTQNKNFSIDTTYIQDFSEKILLRILLDNNIDELENTSLANNFTVKATPNLSEKLSLSVDYKWLLFAVSIPKSWINFDSDQGLKGTSSTTNLGLHLFFNSWVQNFNYSKTRGFYISNTDEVIKNQSPDAPLWQEGVDPYILSPNLSIAKYGGFTSYIFNAKKFSYKSFLWGTELQRKSAGSFILTLLYYYNNLHNGDENIDYNRNSLVTNFSLNYQYNLVILKRFNLSTGIGIGLGASASKTNASDEIENKDILYSPNSITKFNINLTYSYNNFVFGLKSNVQSLWEKANADYNSVNITSYEVIYLGYMFDAPNHISKPVDWLGKKLGFSH